MSIFADNLIEAIENLSGVDDISDANIQALADEIRDHLVNDDEDNIRLLLLAKRILAAINVD